MSRKKFVENNVLWLNQAPIDANGAVKGPNDQFACMKNYGHATVFWIFGNLAADATIAIEQAKDIGGGSAKAYTIDSVYKIPTQAGTARDRTNPVEEVVNATTRTVVNTSPAEDNYVFMVEIEGEQLDVTNGFDCIRPKVTGGSGATLVAMGVIFSNPRFMGSLTDPRQNMSPLAGEQEVLV